MALFEEHDDSNPLSHFLNMPVDMEELPTEPADLGKQYRAFVFTLNNYTDEDIEWLKSWFENGRVRYLVVSKEVAPSSGTPHLQGYVYLKGRGTTWNSMRNNIFGGGRAHIAVAKGNSQQNEQYVKKTREQDEVANEEVFEFGERPKTSKEKGETEVERYERARELALNDNIEDVDADIYVRNYSTLKRIRDDAKLAKFLEDVDEMDNEWLWGDSGTGKSWTARNRYPDAYLKMCNKWWQGYAGESVVLIEDFDKRHDVLVHHLKIWSDRYPFICEVKGSGVKIRPRKIIVTSNYSIQQIWSDPADLEPILRRFKQIHFSGQFNPPLRSRTTSNGTNDFPNPEGLEQLESGQNGQSDGSPIREE